MLKPKTVVGDRRAIRCVRALGTVVLLIGMVSLPNIVEGRQIDPVVTARKLIEEGDRAAAIHLLDAHLSDHPDDEAASFLFAQALSWDDRWPESIVQYDLLLARQPDNADYLLGKSQVFIWSGRPAEALPLLARARILAPGYEAVARLESQAQAAAEGRTGSRELPRSPSIVEGGFSRQWLSNGQPDWTDLYLTGSHKFAANKTVYGTLRQTERFGLTDREITGGAYLPLTGEWLAQLEASVTPGADVRPLWAVQTGIQRPLPWWNLSVEVAYRHAEYSTAYGDLLKFTGTHYWRNYSASWTVFASQLEDADPTFAHMFRLDRYYGDGSRMGFLTAVGDEVESLGSGLFLTSQIHSFGGIGQHWFAPDWGVSWSVNFHKQGTAYNRGGVNLGLQRRF